MTQYAGIICGGGTIDRKSYPLVAWEKVFLPKGEGGLGILQVASWSKASFSKLLWKIVANENYLWVRWTKAAYLKGRSIWNARARDDHPWCWRKLLKLRDAVKNHVEYLVGDGRQLYLFFDNWLISGPISAEIGTNVRRWGENLRVRDWWKPEGGWTIPNSFRRKYPNIAAEISNIQLSDIPDRARWKLNASGCFFVESMYNSLRIVGSKVPRHRRVRASNIPPKYSFCHWLVMRNSLKTKQLLNKRRMGIDPQCILCCRQNEDCDHLFFQCDYAGMVWKKVLVGLGYHRNPLQWRREQRWLHQATRGRNVRARKLKVVLSCTIYYIWQERNLRIFQQSQKSPETLSTMILQFCSLLA